MMSCPCRVGLWDCTAERSLGSVGGRSHPRLELHPVHLVEPLLVLAGDPLLLDVVRDVVPARQVGKGGGDLALGQPVGGVLRAQAWSALPAEPTQTDVAAVEQSAQDATDRLAEREIATALADLTCRDDVPYDAEQQRITSEYQQRFYQVHRVELEAWVASSADAAQ